MSKPRSFRFSDEAEEIIGKQDDPKQFLEDLVLNKQREVKVPWLNLEARIDEVLEAVSKMPKPVKEQGDSTKKPKDCLVEITALEKERDEELKYCQDPDTAFGIHENYQAKIQSLWDEYHKLKELTN